jgi:hypothetical protein
MQFEVKPELHSYQLRHVSFHRGLKDKVMQRNPRLKPPLTSRVIYGCRHCLSEKWLLAWNSLFEQRQKESREAGQSSFTVDDRVITIKSISPYNYYGVLSHVKAR